MIPYASPLSRYTSLVLVPLLVLVVDSRAAAPPSEAALEAGFAVRDITPEGPIFLAGYASRRKPSRKRR